MARGRGASGWREARWLPTLSRRCRTWQGRPCHGSSGVSAAMRDGCRSCHNHEHDRCRACRWCVRACASSCRWSWRICGRSPLSRTRKASHLELTIVKLIDQLVVFNVFEMSPSCVGCNQSVASGALHENLAVACGSSGEECLLMKSDSRAGTRNRYRIPGRPPAGREAPTLQGGA